MATVYKTPGVFIEEIPKFPPSIAQVETAIPAFIGFTEKADNISAGDLNLKPRRISSLVEYELFFGYGPPPKIDKVHIDDANNFKSADVKNTFYLYDSLRLFYSNGGGDCYIVSIGDYNVTTPTKEMFTGGIDTLLKEDDPTIVLFPDAVLLATDADLGAVQAHALGHCADEARRDRVTVFDLKEADYKGVAFRTNVGINYLSYGMAYTPWLKVSLPKNVRYPDVKGVISRGGAPVMLSGLTTNSEVTGLITKIDAAYTDYDKIKAKIVATAGASKTLSSKFLSLLEAYNTAKNVAKFQDIVAFLGAIGKMIDSLVKAGSPDELTSPDLKSDVTGKVGAVFSPIFVEIVGLDKEAVAKINPDYTSQIDVATTFTAASWDAAVGTAAATNVIGTGSNEEKMDSAIPDLQGMFDKLNTQVLSSILESATSRAKKFEEGLEVSFPVYSNILKGVRSSMSAVPPSGAVVGVYAMVDRTRGVWKAPANVSLANVIEPTRTFTKTELDSLNVDVNAGKSINAIRPFFGKGTLVYGARTLAGNDNEWRYIPVRRLFVMIEESVKKATEQFVFEPNDANTWVKVQAMIENFLHILWRQGALQGAKPEHAFYVAVGLNKTMNAVDILEGRMIIEIGIAAVRPAEFIILRFSHKMAES